MACPGGYRGRHTGLYRDTEGKQPRAGNLRTKFQARRPARRAADHEGAAWSPPNRDRRLKARREPGGDAARARR
jgi:hypothetical protein